MLKTPPTRKCWLLRCPIFFETARKKWRAVIWNGNRQSITVAKIPR